LDRVELKDSEFLKFQQMLSDIAGINLSPSKKPLVVNRLMKRLREYRLSSFSSYLNLITSSDGSKELQTAIDLLTTNETYFFRESNHFDFFSKYLEQRIVSHSTLRVWSAACSSGQEPYSIAMLLADQYPSKNWEVYASDISTKILNVAKLGIYPIEQSKKIPNTYLSKYCLRGIDDQVGNFLIDRPLRQKINFFQVNLNTTLPRVGEFDAIFLRNVMIYFNAETKRQVVKRVLRQLKVGGIFFIGHSESLNGISDDVESIAPSIFKKIRVIK